MTKPRTREVGSAQFPADHSQLPGRGLQCPRMDPSIPAHGLPIRPRPPNPGKPGRRPPLSNPKGLAGVCTWGQHTQSTGVRPCGIV